MRPIQRSAGLVVAIALIAVSCDDESEPSSTEAAVETDAPATDPPSTGEPSTGEPEPEPEPEPADEPADGASEDALGPIPTGDAGSPWCGAARDVQESFDALDLIDFNDPAELESTYREALARIDAAREFVPPELADAVDTAATGLDDLVVELDRVDWSFIDVDLSVIDTAAQEVAGNAIDRYNFYVCEIDNDYDPNDAGTSDDGLDLDTSQTIREGIVESLLPLGFSEEEANCIADRFDFTGDDLDEAALTQLFVDCGISLDRLAALGAG